MTNLTSNNTYFISDLHFAHRRILENFGRNKHFNSLEEMHNTIISNWNAIITNRDVVFILGDIGLGDKDVIYNELCKLQGQLVLIKGNHDRLDHRTKKRFQYIKDYHEIKIFDEDEGRKQMCVLCHYPLKEWRGFYNNPSSFHLFGHCHGTLKNDPLTLSLDVCVENHDYTPWSYMEVKDHMKKKTHYPRSMHKHVLLQQKE